MAGGAAGAIYKFLGIKDDAQFPQAVIDAVSCESQAKLHRYNKDGANLECIHVVGPDFRADNLKSEHQGQWRADWVAD